MEKVDIVNTTNTMNGEMHLISKAKSTKTNTNRKTNINTKANQTKSIEIIRREKKINGNRIH